VRLELPIHRPFILFLGSTLAFTGVVSGNGTPDASTSMRSLSDFLADESGATAIEYALIATFIAMAILASLNALGAKIGSNFDVIRTALN
jgi:pilus assembly protein Flp/PilA